MDLTIITSFMSPIILIACLIVGYVVKHLVPGDTVNRFIPLIVTVLGIILNIWACGWMVDLTVVVTGAMSGLASTGLYELFSQLIEKGLTNKTEEVIVEEEKEVQ